MIGLVQLFLPSNGMMHRRKTSGRRGREVLYLDALLAFLCGRAKLANVIGGLYFSGKSRPIISPGFKTVSSFHSGILIPSIGNL